MNETKTSREIGEKKPIKGSMVQGNPTKCLLAFAVPLIAGNLFQQLYNIVDSIIVGKVVGAGALASVGASAAITMLFVMVALGTGIGCSVVISQLFGAKKIEEMKTAISTALISILIFSLLLSVIGRVFSTAILQVLKTPEDIFEGAALYLNIYFYGFFFLFMYNAFSAIFNALGDSMKPLMFLIFSSFLNIGLDLLFVKVFSWGIAGAAWATLISQAVSAVLSFGVLAYKLKHIPSKSYPLYDVTLFRSMTRVALPTIIQQSMVSVGSLLIQAAVNRFGSTFLAGYTAAIRIDGIAIVPMVNTGNAVSTFVAQNMGAKRADRAKQGYHIGLVMAMSIGAFIGIMMHFYGDSFVGLFMNAETDMAAIAIGAEYISIVSMFYFVMGAMNVSGAVLRGAGDMKWFMSATLVNLSSRVILTYLFADATAGMIIMWANPIGWAIGFAISFTRYRQGGWKKITLIR
ncbi:MAG: MATE family efflux transporter [Lachnospiraceae bacterium]|nr:MATE family efflux transporter [Lachnospiraceae bacterium]